MNEDDKNEKMPCRDVPVVKAHWAQEVPKYEYEKHRAPIKVE